MRESSIRFYQRYLRAKLSFMFNQTEKANTEINKIMKEIQNFKKKNLNNKNKKLIHTIFSNRVFELIDKKFLNFLQLSFVQQMFFIHNRLYLLFYLIELKISVKWPLWKELIKESKIGNPVRYFLYPRSSGNKIFQVYHIKKYEDFSKINVKSFDEVIEFGGGYGNMALTFKKINPNINYIIFDTFEVNILQYYYLRRNNFKINFNYQAKNNHKIILINTLKKLKNYIKKSKSKKKLLIANWSISETPLKFRKDFFFLFKEADYQLISFQNKFEGINNNYFFKKILNFNLTKKRHSKIINIKKMKNHHYLFCKK